MAYPHPFQKKGILYLDVDDTIIAENFVGSGHDLRPWVMTQIRVLTELFDVRWLTCVSEESLEEMFKRLYAYRYFKNTTYCHWRNRPTSGKNEKVDYVLDNYVLEGRNWYWVEDLITIDDAARLAVAGMASHYIPVNPVGPWEFTKACKELFKLANVTEKDIRSVEGDPQWFCTPFSQAAELAEDHADSLAANACDYPNEDERLFGATALRDYARYLRENS